jgi:ubiquinone/menaquinone biosynthesis C-methylase UbiE
MDADATSYYEDGHELERLASWGWLEFERTKELLGRVLPEAGARVLDIGGGPGAYAEWLATLGHRVHLVDAVPLHVEQATARAAGRFTAAVGDARSLAEADASLDVVLLLGPLYHLTENGDRRAALAEARRVLAPGGLIAATAISRFASLLDGLAKGFVADERFAAIVERDLRDGQHRNTERQQGWFTTAYFHHPDELRAEVEDAGFVLEGLYGIEGATVWSMDSGVESDAERRRFVEAARAVETEPTLLGASPHLLALAHKPA